MRFLTKALIYTAMWLVAIFAFQVVVAFVFQQKYVYPSFSHVLALSAWFWGTVFLPIAIVLIVTLFDRIFGYWWSDLLDWLKPSTYDDYSFIGRMMKAFLNTVGFFILFAIVFTGIKSLFTLEQAQYLVCLLTGFFTFIFDIKFIGFEDPYES